MTEQTPKKAAGNDGGSSKKRSRRRGGRRRRGDKPRGEVTESVDIVSQEAEQLDQASTEPVDLGSVHQFAALGLNERLCTALARMGWTEPSEIQANLIPVAIEGHDILGQARTGTGKTAAFSLPILQQLTERPVDAAEAESHGGPPLRCLVLAPTRELAAQVASEMRRMAAGTGQLITMAYGGTRMRSQVMELKRHPSIVVGTPGRVMDLMERRLLHLDKLEFAVLDEVDRMLDIGFRDDIRRILSQASSARQTIFVSATIDEDIKRLAMRYMHEPKEIFLAPDKKTVDEVDQFYISVQSEDKKRLLAELLRRENPSLAIVFTRTKRETARVAKYLSDHGLQAREIHGDLMQSKRESIMKRFRQGHINVLVATDLASRGIDVDDISHIINYDIPEDPEAYVHRVGRTARMGSRGRAFVFVTREQGGELTNIEIFINREVPAYELEGFEFSQPRQVERTTPPEEEEAPSSRPATLPQRLRVSEQEQEAADAAEANATRPRRTLGSKFPPRRRRR